MSKPLKIQEGCVLCPLRELLVSVVGRYGCRACGMFNAYDSELEKVNDQMA